MKFLILTLASLFGGLASAGGPGYHGNPRRPPSDGFPHQFGPPIRHNGSFVPDHVLRVTYGNLSVGCQYRPSALINGTSPGPEVRLAPGTTSWIRVYNDMSDYNLTMHWHGLSERTALFSDGTPLVSQHPIPPHHYFDYEVHPEEDDAGTYFYHSHVGFQAVSAHGPLIVEDAGPPPYQYDDERIVMLSDYFNNTDSTIEAGLTANPFVWSGETNAVLINGVGVAMGEKAGVGECQLPVIDVEPGKTYRLRFIGGTSLSMVQLGIVGHKNLTIVGADGRYTKPHVEPFMQLSSGQRFEVILQAKTEEELGNRTDYLIQFETKDRPTIYRGYGVLRYSKASATIRAGPVTPPLSFSNETYSWLEYALEPLVPNGFPTAQEVTRRLVIGIRQLPKGTIVWQLNGLEWNTTIVPGGTPYLIKIYEEGEAAMPDYDAALKNNGWDPETYVWPAKLGEVLEIIIYNQPSLVNGGLDYHPFHAHGGHYFDIGSGNGTYNATENELKLKGYNPVLRDTTNLYRYNTKQMDNSHAGWRAWRLRVEDAGVWMIHCHILQHMVMGMQTVFTFGSADEIRAIPINDVQGYLTFRGDAYGNVTHAPSYVHQFGW